MECCSSCGLPSTNGWAATFARGSGGLGSILFRPASSLQGLSFNFAPLDELIGRLELGSLACFTGAHAEAAAELLSVRAQLPRQDGGLASKVIFIDGGNCSNLYLFSSYARQHGIKPDRALRNVMTSRAFTIYQLASLISKELPKVVSEYDSRFVVVSDLFSMFGDPQLRIDEAQRIIEGMVEHLRNLCDLDALVLVTMKAVTKFDRALTDAADVFLDLEAERSTVRGTLLKHPSRKAASACFRPQDFFSVGLRNGNDTIWVEQSLRSG